MAGIPPPVGIRILFTSSCVSPSILQLRELSCGRALVGKVPVVCGIQKPGSDGRAILDRSNDWPVG
jgi:hypothetical protein